MSYHEKMSGQSQSGGVLRAVCLTIFGMLTTLLLAACLIPPVMFRLTHGRGPLSWEEYRQAGNARGLTADQLRELLGEPHLRYDEADGEESWYYWGDSYGFGYVGIRFGRDGQVIYTWI